MRSGILGFDEKRHAFTICKCRDSDWGAGSNCNASAMPKVLNGDKRICIIYPKIGMNAGISAAHAGSLR